ncbi:P-loop containing nucleoside triphosphate hydrolase protein [Boletus edulis BED1]|uniref:P-loop containing nucleoside triphosphate hydrolase protein n=1 Tax=Boletus edulis BED1 TaxID=1328754 RepID=A0AAD4BW41_BOLED|nr:P-loop containing nucleoside triphosphate hydrolase protein [Boletus edulis BED1]
MHPISLLPIHARVRALLRSTCNGGAFTIAGRSTERDVITKFIASGCETSCSDVPPKASLFISGSPGTGKTALVNSVLAGLECSQEFKVITVNCMALNNVDNLWDCLCENIGNSTLVKRNKTVKAKGKRLLDRILASQERRCLIVLDELDHIAKSPHALSTIFLLARKHSSVRIIGIANTHTLPVSASLSNDEAANVLTLHFGAYTASQLLEILQARLLPLSNADHSEQLNKFLPIGPLTLLSKKVASQTGDVRTLFEVLRGAIDLAISSPTPPVENPLGASVPPVTPNHILAALKAYLPSNSSRSNSSIPRATVQSNNSETAVKVRNLGLQSRLVLLAIVLASKRRDAALPLSSISNSPLKTPTKRTSLTSKLRILELPQLYTYYASILERSENGLFTSVSRSEFSDLVSVLETSGIVSLSTPCSMMLSPSKSGRRGVSRTSSFGSPSKGTAFTQEIQLVDSLRVEEVLRGLGMDAAASTNTDPREEEVRAIWIRESRRTTRDMAPIPPCVRNPDLFEAAFQG